MAKGPAFNSTPEYDAKAKPIRVVEGEAASPARPKIAHTSVMAKGPTELPGYGPYSANDTKAPNKTKMPKGY